jgi:DNA-binding beta-propeller fold protein YncE
MGNFLLAWGAAGGSINYLNYPMGLALDAAGRVYVADNQNHRIQVFDSSGASLATIGTYGTGVGQFTYVFGVAVDANGTIYGVDAGNNRIHVITR